MDIPTIELHEGTWCFIVPGLLPSDRIKVRMSYAEIEKYEKEIQAIAKEIEPTV